MSFVVAAVLSLLFAFSCQMKIIIMIIKATGRLTFPPQAKLDRAVPIFLREKERKKRDKESYLESGNGAVQFERFLN